MSITLTTMKSKELWLPICLEWSQSRNWQSSKAEQDPPVHSPTGEVHGLGSGKMGSSLAWDGCWRLLLINSTGSDSAAAALRGWKQGVRLSSTLILLCWPTPLMRWPGLGHGWLRADKSSRDSRIGCAKGPCTTSLFTQCWFCVLPIFFFVCNKSNTWSPGQMNCPLYCHGKSFLVLHWLSMQPERSRGLCLL